MIHRDGYNGPITFECDVCNNDLDTECDDFQDAINLLKEEGWVTRKINNEWFHLCSFDCQKQATRENRPKLPEVHNMSQKDAAAWLGLTEKPTKEEAKSMYRKLIQTCHPDHGGSTALAQLLNEAYEKLK